MLPHSWPEVPVHFAILCMRPNSFSVPAIGYPPEEHYHGYFYEGNATVRIRV